MTEQRGSAQVEVAACEVTIGYRVLATVGEIASRVAPAHRYAIVSDSNVAPLYAERLRRSFGDARTGLHVVPAGESYKTREQWAALTDELLATGAGRDTTIVALGGGVVGDLAGFVAATFMRGIPVVQVPTTLLAMVDASIGGKTGVDTPHGKNLVGAFHPPAAVVADVELLGTLPPRELRAGLAEVVKHALIADENLFDRLASELPSLTKAPWEEWVRIVGDNVAIKAGIVADDEREAGRRKVLNFGHTLGHAVEHVSGYSLLHGEAVAIGMVLECMLAEQIGVAEAGTAARVGSALEAAGLATVLPAGLDRAALLAATHADKKMRGGEVAYALPARIGEMAGAESGWAVPVPDEDVARVLGVV